VREETGLYEGGAAAPDVDAEATAAGPARRRASWSLKSIVEDVAGRPIGDLQDPERPVHPYLEGKGISPTAAPRRLAETESPYDPVEHVYPPLIGPIGRSYHGAEHEHHADTLEHHPTHTESTPGNPARPGGPMHRPERIYLHYLLLHMDRLSPSALQYLRTAVEEELAHRARPPLPPASE
jgi:hypothetical protein